MVTVLLSFLLQQEFQPFFQQGPVANTSQGNGILGGVRYFKLLSIHWVSKFVCFVVYGTNNQDSFYLNFSCPRCEDCSNCNWSSHLTDCTSLPATFNCTACYSGNNHPHPKLQCFCLFFFKGSSTVISYTSLTVVSHWLQALPLVQQLEPKTQTSHSSGTEAASMSAATVTAPPGQAAPASNGMCLEFY